MVNLRLYRIRENINLQCIKKSKRTLKQGSFFVYLYMKKTILKYFINKLSKPRVSEIRYFWIRFWIEKLQDPEENYALMSRYAKAVNLISDSHIQYQLSNIINDCFVCDKILYLIINGDDLYAFKHDICYVCASANINGVKFINDQWTSRKIMHDHLIFNSLV